MPKNAVFHVERRSRARRRPSQGLNVIMAHASVNIILRSKNLYSTLLK